MRDPQRYAPAVLLAVGCLFVSGLRPQQKMAPRTHMNAITIAAPGYATRDTLVSDFERKVAGMSDYVLRFYQRDANDPGFSVYVGYYDYQVQGKTIHSPKNCLPGAGWEQLSTSVQPVVVGDRTYPVNRYLLSNKGQQALVYYWYQGRGRIEANEYRVKYNLLRDAALFGRTEEALVRIVVPLTLPTQQDQVAVARAQAQADTLATQVAAKLIPAVSGALPPAPGA